MARQENRSSAALAEAPPGSIPATALAMLTIPNVDAAAIVTGRSSSSEEGRTRRADLVVDGEGDPHVVLCEDVADASEETVRDAVRCGDNEPVASDRLTESVTERTSVSVGLTLLIGSVEESVERTLNDNDGPSIDREQVEDHPSEMVAVGALNETVWVISQRGPLYPSRH